MIIVSPESERERGRGHLQIPQAQRIRIMWSSEWVREREDNNFRDGICRRRKLKNSFFALLSSRRLPNAQAHLQCSVQNYDHLGFFIAFFSCCSGKINISNRMKKGKKNKRKQISLSLLFGDDYDVWRVQFFISNLHKRAKQKQQKKSQPMRCSWNWLYEESHVNFLNTRKLLFFSW